MGTKWKITILGAGNLLLQDEGVGVHICRRLAQKNLPAGVEVFEGGTDALGLLPLLEDCDKLILIDALQGGSAPGTIYRLGPEDIVTEEAQSDPLGSRTLHQQSALDILQMAGLIRELPETVIFAIEPKETNYGLSLSPEVAEAVPRVVELVFNEVAHY